MNHGLSEGQNFVFPGFPWKRGVVSCSIPPVDTYAICLSAGLGV